MKDKDTPIELNKAEHTQNSPDPAAPPPPLQNASPASALRSNPLRWLVDKRPIALGMLVVAALTFGFSVRTDQQNRHDKDQEIRDSISMGRRQKAQAAKTTLMVRLKSAISLIERAPKDDGVECDRQRAGFFWQATQMVRSGQGDESVDNPGDVRNLEFDLIQGSDVDAQKLDLAIDGIENDRHILNPTVELHTDWNGATPITTRHLDEMLNIVKGANIK